MRNESRDSNRPAPEGFDSWKAYWAAQGMPWRTEPEIDAERQAYLAERRDIKPNIKEGVYPFKDIALSRADVEWLLTTHKSGSIHGPVHWSDSAQVEREGLDLRGANLRGVDLSGEFLAGLPLTRLRAGLSVLEWANATPSQREAASVHLEGANLTEAHLEFARLRGAHCEGANLRRVHFEQGSLEAIHLQGADLRRAHLEGADMFEALLGGMKVPHDEWHEVQQHRPDYPEVLAPADLRSAFFDAASTLRNASFGDSQHGWPRVVDVRWGGVNLAVVNWSNTSHSRRRRGPKGVILGDERILRKSAFGRQRQKDPNARLIAYERAVRANRQIAIALKNQGLNEHSDCFAYRARVLQRRVMLRQGVRMWPTYLGSLFLDLLAGYGYRPGRAILLYFAVILWFANFYVWASHGMFSLGLPPTHVQPLAWYEGLILSVSSFHGRGFQPFQNLNDPIAALAGMQAVFGLIIEVSFIATFTQRFFAR